MKIAGLQRVSLIDYPERIAATVFLAGCNLNCRYCYNRWMIRETGVPEAISVDAFLVWLETRKGLLDGVCVSGGEPTAQAELPHFLGSIKSLGFSAKLDTNGTYPGRLEALFDGDLLDYVAMDVKAPLDSRYDEVAACSVDLDAIRESMRFVRSWGGEYEFRTTVGPQLDFSALEGIAREIEATELWFLQPFLLTPSVDPSLADLGWLDEGALTDAARRLSSMAPRVRVRGA
jgi:pyruvate formate lyase activating enzyme